ncbi:MAG: hypothetical protein WC119_01280 [Synergistaceae bacterium]
MSLYSKAFSIAKEAHDGQKRKFGRDQGADYIVHPIRVADNCKGMAKVAAILHDVIEDSDITAKDLIARGIPTDIVAAVQLLSKKEGDNYFDFIMRICNSNDFSDVYQIAAIVKIADLNDNMSDLQEGSLKDKYRFAKYILQNRLNLAYERGEINDNIFSDEVK